MCTPWPTCAKAKVGANQQAGLRHARQAAAVGGTAVGARQVALTAPQRAVLSPIAYTGCAKAPACRAASPGPTCGSPGVTNRQGLQPSMISWSTSGLMFTATLTASAPAPLGASGSIPSESTQGPPSIAIARLRTDLMVGWCRWAGRRPAGRWRDGAAKQSAAAPHKLQVACVSPYLRLLLHCSNHGMNAPVSVDATVASFVDLLAAAAAPAFAFGPAELRAAFQWGATVQALADDAPGGGAALTGRLQVRRRRRRRQLPPAAVLLPALPPPPDRAGFESTASAWAAR